MPIAFIAIGALFLIAAVRGTLTDGPNGQPPGLLTLLKSDFVSTDAKGNFLVWMVTLWIVGALGYIPGFKPIANALLFLIILVLFLSNSKNAGQGGIFAELNAALVSQTQTSSTDGTAATNGSASVSISQGGIGPITPMQPPVSSSNPFSGNMWLNGPSGGSNTGGAFLPGQTIQVPGLNGVGFLGG